MTLAPLAAALTALASGQSTDAFAYQVYQARLAKLEAPQQAVAAATATVPSANVPSATATPGCALRPGAGNLFTTSDCTACHTAYAARHSHPVDVPQDSMRSRSLRPSAEVIRRGVFLADGRVTCLSCHDGDSAWKYKLAMPPGAALRPRVKPGRPETYAVPVALRDPASMALGSDVSPAPLCKACHAFD
ncbi:MAG TPA: hypothetical protein VFM53_03540 [Anaeromyxobacteraceae bacterium]|nr:hypothetical protein [Anaeromyxobacteraceae bacterium]